MINLNAKYKDTLDYILSRAPFKPDFSIILGSGLGNFAERVEIISEISSEEIPGYPPSTVPGHSGKIYFCEHQSKKIILFKGRLHFYEGYSLSQCVLPVFISYRAGCSKILLTNAAGSSNPAYTPGDLMLAESVNGLLIKNELTDLIGLATPEGKNNLLNFPSIYLNGIIKKAAELEAINLQTGVYWYNKGPSYETPAEVRMAYKMGADSVGMSTAHEAVFSAYLGMQTSVISCITNYGSGITGKKLSHHDVIETADIISSRFEQLVKKVIELA